MADDEAIVVPVGSPVKFLRFAEGGDVAKFSGRFVLTGRFSYGCEFDCEQPVTDADLFLRVIPDASLAERLPHWKRHGNAIRIAIDHQLPIGRILTSAQQRRALRMGKLDYVTGRISIVVEDFEASLDCDSANYVARYVRVAEPPKIARVDMAGHFGCG